MTITSTARKVVGTKAVTVTITNVNEDGSVSLNRPQPQVEITVTATLSDPDNTDAGTITDTTWQWSKSMDMTTWADIDGATQRTYTPAVADIGHYLQATATYADMHGEGQTASSGASEEPVEPETSANAVPDFGKEDMDDDKDADDGEEEDGSADDPFQRSVAENTAAKMNIGNPIAATDTDMDVLVYTLSDSDGADAEGDAAKFEIDDRSGQITVKTVLNFEAASGADNADANDNDVFAVVVTATDPSEATKTAEVRITVTDVNEAPDFGSDDATAVTIAENTQLLQTMSGDDPLVLVTIEPYIATDDDTVGTPDTRTYSLGGDDASAFEIGETNGVLTIKAAPDFEEQSSYSIIVMAKDANADDDDHSALTTPLPVTVTVTNVDEDGEVTFSQIQPQVGVAITAMLEDPDGGVTGTTWQWATQAVGGGGDCPAAGGDSWADITDETSATYTPRESNLDDNPDDGNADDAQCLRATASYTDNAKTADDATTEEDESIDTMAGVADNAVDAKTTGNAAPSFGEVKADEDSETPFQDGSAESPFVRSVMENTGAGVGVEDPVAATDSLPTGDTEKLIYTIGGPDGDSFDIDYRTTAEGVTPVMAGGQIKTKGALDFETKSSYMVEVTATDPSLAAKTVMVMIMIGDVNEKAEIILRPADNVAPMFADDAETDFMVYENMDAGAEVGTVTADDPGDTLTYTDDSMYFDVDGMGNITTTMMLDHEAMASHTVIITATDSDDATDTLDVTINVEDMHPDCTVMDNNGLTNDCEALLDAHGRSGRRR